VHENFNNWVGTAHPVLLATGHAQALVVLKEITSDATLDKVVAKAFPLVHETS
jgi:hypothetical protein